MKSSDDLVSDPRGFRAGRNADGLADTHGTVQVDEEQRPMNYTQVFQLLPDGAGSYFIFNDIFKLIYGL